jgi:hypothetical protein
MTREKTCLHVWLLRTTSLLARRPFHRSVHKLVMEATSNRMPPPAARGYHALTPRMPPPLGTLTWYVNYWTVEVTWHPSVSVQTNLP